jgi:hypothetical protein
MDEPASKKSLQSAGCVMLFSLPFLLAGGYIMATSLGYLPADEASFHAPRWVVALAGLVFVMGGLMVLVNGLFGEYGRDTPVFKFLQGLGGMIFLLAFGLVFFWVGFGPGEREFETSGSVGPFSASGSGDSLFGRCLFGGIGLAVLAAAVWGLLDTALRALGLLQEKPKKE